LWHEIPVKAELQKMEWYKNLCYWLNDP
jgi:hypothetical protein